MGDQYPDIDRLIGLYLSGRASTAEKKELEEWLKASPANQAVFEQIKKVWLSSQSLSLSPEMEKTRERIWKAGAEQSQPVRHRFIDITYWSKVAAVFIIFLLGAAFFSYLIDNNSTLSLPEPVAMMEVTNPSGQRSVHALPDGSKVWLNAESSLTYPETFSDTLRQLQLLGEAFFEVARDPKRPFIVEAAGTHTQALGTAFNVHAYPEEDTMRIALLEGKVKVQSEDQVQTAILSPGEVLSTPRDHSEFYKKPFDYVRTFGWKEGILIFDGTDFQSFRTTIERWYGVQVTYQGTPPHDWHIRAKYQNEDLRHVLRDICFNKNISFELNGKNVLFTF